MNKNKEVEKMISKMPFKKRLDKNVEESRKIIKEAYIGFMKDAINKELLISDAEDGHSIKERNKRIEEYAETLTFILTRGGLKKS